MTFYQLRDSIRGLSRSVNLKGCGRKRSWLRKIMKIFYQDSPVAVEIETGNLPNVRRKLTVCGNLFGGFL
jgi:hypothetical protein